MSLAVGVVVPAGVAEPQVTNIGQADELLFLCANLGERPSPIRPHQFLSAIIAFPPRKSIPTGFQWVDATISV